MLLPMVNVPAGIKTIVSGDKGLVVGTLVGCVVAGAHAEAAMENSKMTSNIWPVDLFIFFLPHLGVG